MDRYSALSAPGISWCLINEIHHDGLRFPASRRIKDLAAPVATMTEGNIASRLLGFKDRLTLSVKGVASSVLASLNGEKEKSRSLEEDDTDAVVHLQVGLQLWPSVARDLRTEL